MLLMRTLCHIMEQLWNQTGKSVDFFFFGLSLFLLIYVFFVNKNHQHVQCWNLTTTNSFT